MKISEYRVPLPFTVEEFRRGELYMVAKATKANLSGSGEGIEFVECSYYDNTDGKMPDSTLTGTKVPRNRGRYTKKIYRFASKVPSFILKLYPPEKLYLLEECWHSYPNTLTVQVCGPFSHDVFRLVFETAHLDGPPNPNLNPLNLPKNTPISILDISKANQDAPEKNPCLVRSALTNRGPLKREWWTDQSIPCLTAYKAVSLHLNLKFIGGMASSFAINMISSVFETNLCMAYLALDEWYPLSLSEIHKLMDDVANQCNTQLATFLKRPPPPVFAGYVPPPPWETSLTKENPSPTSISTATPVISPSHSTEHSNQRHNHNHHHNHHNHHHHGRNHSHGQVNKTALSSSQELHEAHNDGESSTHLVKKTLKARRLSNHERISTQDSRTSRSSEHSESRLIHDAPTLEL